LFRVSLRWNPGPHPIRLENRRVVCSFSSLSPQQTSIRLRVVASESSCVDSAVQGRRSHGRVPFLARIFFPESTLEMRRAFICGCASISPKIGRSRRSDLSVPVGPHTFQAARSEGKPRWNGQKVVSSLASCCATKDEKSVRKIADPDADCRSVTGAPARFHPAHSAFQPCVRPHGHNTQKLTAEIA
jgi:hypothetical protein